jgi:hypothetical protein
MPWNRQTWVSLSPTGLRETKPGHFREMARIAWDNRRELPFAWRIRLASDSGEFRGFVKVAPIKPGNLEVHWAGGTAVADECRSGVEIAGHNALVRVERA